MIVNCNACGLSNHDAASSCRRCGESLLVGRSAGRSAAPLVGKGVWREGDVVVIRNGSSLPDRCIRCGGPFHLRLDHTFYWHNPLLYLLVFLNILIYAIVASVVRKKSFVQLGLCEAHALQRRRGLHLAWGTAGIAIGGLALSLAWRVEILPFVLIAAIVGVVLSNRDRSLPKAILIDTEYLRLKGAGSSFVQILPAFGKFR